MVYYCLYFKSQMCGGTNIFLVLRASKSLNPALPSVIARATMRHQPPLIQKVSTHVLL